MNKLKELWQYAVFRWCVYFPVGYGIAWLLGFLSGITFPINGFNGDQQDFLPWSFPIAFVITALWVWRKAIWRVIGFLNRIAEEE